MCSIHNDIVIDTLQKQHDNLRNLVAENIASKDYTILDQIYVEQMNQICTAMDLWKDWIIQWEEMRKK
jgi:hypothetical protein